MERILQEVESRINTTSTGDKYINIGETKKSNNCSIQCGEPILLNPNSHENLELIMGNSTQTWGLVFQESGVMWDVMVLLIVWQVG